MFITTKAEFEWNGEEYVEVHTEGYEYEGELSLAYRPGSVGDSGPSGSSDEPYSPSLAELTSTDVGTIMKNMGFSDEAVEKYAGYVPQYDPWKAGYAQEEYGLGMDRLDLQRSGVETQSQLTENLFGLSGQRLQQQMFGAASKGEQSLYGAYQQQSAIGAAGLGQRRNISDRLRAQGISQYESGMDALSISGLEQESRYDAAMQGFANQLSMLDIESDMAGVDLRRDVEAEKRQYEDDFWEFMTFLKSNFDVGGEE